jgi:hypothetical protein
VYTYNGILLKLKKEGNSDTCNYMDKTLRHYSASKKPVIRGQILYEFVYMRYLVQFIETKKRLPGTGVMGNEQLQFNAYGVCFAR